MSKFMLSAFADEIDEKLQTQMDVLDEHDIKYIEMRGVNGKNIVNHSLEEVKEIKKQLDARGFRISAVGSPIGKIGIMDNFDTHLDLFKHTVEIAKLLDTSYIRMFSFYIPKGENPAKYRNEVLSRLDSLIKAAEGSGITLLHENEKGIYGDIPERCLELLEKLDCTYFKAVFDPANFIQCGVESYPHAFNVLKKHVVYFHIKDALFSDHSVVPSGYGDGRLPQILKTLHDEGFEGFLSLEPHLGNFKGFAALEPDAREKTENMPEGGPKLFAIAVEALKDILCRS